MPHIISSFVKEIHSKTTSLPVVCSLLSVADTTGEWTSNIWGGLGSVTQSYEVDTTVNTDRQVQWLTAPAACEIVQPVLPGDSNTFRSIKAEPVTLSDTDIMTILYSKQNIHNHSSDIINCEIVRDSSSWNSVQNEPIRATDTPKEKTNEPIRATDAPKEKINDPIRATDALKEKINEPFRATDTPKGKTEPVRCTCNQGSSKCGPVVESEGVTETTTVIKREPITDSDSAPTIQPVDDSAVIKTDTAVSLDSWSPREGQERLPSPPQPTHRQVGQKWEVLC